MVTDRYLTFGTIKGVQAHQESAKAPTYLYYFSFKDGAHNMANVIGSKPGEWGASHGEVSDYCNVSLHSIRLLLNHF